MIFGRPHNRNKKVNRQASNVRDSPPPCWRASG